MRSLSSLTFILVVVISVSNEPSAYCSDHDQPGWISADWELDERCVLPRGEDGAIDFRVVGDPCIVWDQDINSWRMFYFASGIDPVTGLRGPRTAMAIAASQEEIGPGDWRKIGFAPVVNESDLLNTRAWHKWWVVMDAYRPNQAALIDGKYWSVFSTGTPDKVIYAAWSNRLAGPWTVVKEPILRPDPNGLDGRHCDTPTAFWFADSKSVLLFYKAYPKQPQANQTNSNFGSGSVVATWHPSQMHAEKGAPILLPGITDDWAKGWIGGVQLLHDSNSNRWYGLMNSSPTSPKDDSHREPAPSLGGWLVCNSATPETGWSVETDHSPLRTTESLTESELDAGLGVNFWRHHLLVTPGGQARIFFNSGAYGKEQMYSLYARQPVKTHKTAASNRSSKGIGGR